MDALNNILIIGMTNRKDMLDEAVLRPGRLEVRAGGPSPLGSVERKGAVLYARSPTYM